MATARRPSWASSSIRATVPTGRGSRCARPSRAEVDRLAEIARASGATAFEPPHVCEEYTPFYYATFFEDADGNKLEICYRKPRSR